MKLTQKMIDSGDEEALLDGDDAVQTDDGYGGRIEPDVDMYRFTFRARARSERWDVVVDGEQIGLIAAGALKELPRLPERPAWDSDVPTGIFAESEAEAAAKHKALEELLRRAGGAAALDALLDDDDDDDDGDDGDDGLGDVVDAEEAADAKRLLDFMLEVEALELAEGADTSALVTTVVPIIRAQLRNDHKAAKLAETLLDHAAVEELHCSDRDLEKLLERW